nr:hypothetical protein [Tanacetum cinerariifolium]
METNSSDGISIRAALLERG